MKRRSALAGIGATLSAVLAGALPISLSAKAPAAGPRWITLGTSGGPQVQAGRAQIANALVVGDAVYLFDLGNDVQRQLARAGVAERNLRAAFLSHHHLDHNADLGPVMLTHWMFGTGRLRIIGPAGTGELARGISTGNAPTVLASYPTIGPARPTIADTIAVTDLPDTLPQPTEVYRDEHVVVTAITVDHYQTPPSIPLSELPRAVAFRIEAGGRSFVYSGDTGPSPGLERLARGADYLITEVVDLDGIAARIAESMPNTPAPVRERVVEGMRINHLTTDEIGKLARAAGVGTVVLTHFVPNPEQLARPTDLIKRIRQHFTGRVIMARDLDVFR